MIPGYGVHCTIVHGVHGVLNLVLRCTLQYVRGTAVYTGVPRYSLLGKAIVDRAHMVINLIF